MKGRDVDIDHLVDDDHRIDDGRESLGASGRRRIPGARAFVAFRCVIGMILIGFMVWRAFHPAKSPDDGTGKPQTMTNALPKYEFNASPLGASASSPASNVAAASANAPGDTSPPTARPSANQKHVATPEEIASARRLGQGSGSAAGSAQGSDQLSESTVSRVAARAEPSRDSAGLASKMTSVPTESAKASMLKHASLTVPSATMIPCGNKTELDTTVPGMVSCQVSRDVYSADSKVRLIDKGAIVTGEISSGIKQGQTRVFVLWTRLRNPDNVVVNIDSPGTNRLGSAGIPGQVDTHFWDRFAGAMFISVFSDVGQALVQVAANSANHGGGNTQVNLDNTSNTSDSLAREALRASIDIPPTLYDQQGDTVSIFVRRDLDFSNVYGLSADGS
jgi:type IV secretion system protein VirB10